MDQDYALFATIVEAGSLSAAARTLSMSPAMVSKRLARLEARLGARLIHRTTRRLALTEVGDRFSTDVAAILNAVADAENRVMGNVNQPAGPLRVSAPTSFGRLHITPRLPAFLDAHPAIRFELDLSDDYIDLFDGRTDLAIRIATDMPASLTAYRLSGNPRILCASPDYLIRYGSPETLAALADHRLLAATGQLPWHLVYDRKTGVVNGTSHVRTNSSEVVRELAITGVGIALRSLWDVGEALAGGALVRVLPDWEGTRDLSIYAVHPKSPIVPLAVTAFVAFLTEAFASDAWPHGRG